MSRLIKFRGQIEDNKEWVYGSLIEDKYIVGKVIDWNEDYFNTEYWWRVIPKTIGRFTGRTDDGGDELYDGDIISFDYELKSYEGVIEWSEALSAFVVKRKDEVPLFLYDIDDAVTKIGDIYGN